MSCCDRSNNDRGCVTPAVLHNWNETADGDMEMVDGYEELPAELQEKVKRALEQGHVDDGDWMGVSVPTPPLSNARS